LTYDLDLDSVKVNQHAKYLGQRSLSSNVIAQTHRHTTDQLPFMDQQSGQQKPRNNTCRCADILL